MGGGRALLGPADVQDGVAEIDLIPAQVDKLGRPQAVAEGDKDHGGIPVTPAIGLGGIDQPIDLGASQVLPGPIDGVRFTSGTSFRGDLVMVSLRTVKPLCFVGSVTVLRISNC